MSGAGAARLDLTGAVGLRVGVVAASWHDQIMAALIDNAIAVCDESGVEVVGVHRVPGSFELPIAAAAVCASGVDAVIALGVVIRGGTPHFEFVCDAATTGLARVALDSGVPVGFGLLTCDTEQQALDRAGLKDSPENKGREAAEAAIATALQLRRIRSLQ